MKKMININFQGRVIPIEETSFEILKNYIESLRIYFSKEEGRDEIINDIESRIAELFSERLKHTACITDEDVNNVIAGMGRPQDFEEAEATGNYNVAQGVNDRSDATPQDAISERRQWRRALNDKILGGVCGGIANYLKIDTTIIRVIFAVLTIGSFGFWVLVYILLWVILPEQVMAPSNRKRFYRSGDHKVLGGVAGGLAAYFGTDVWLPRLIFAAPLLINILAGALNFGFFASLFGGVTATTAIVYIILWIILPVARTASAKLEMKGEQVNLKSIRTTVQEDPGVVIQPRTGGAARAVGIIFKAFFLFIAGCISLVFITATMGILFGGVIGGTGIYPLKDFIIESPWQNVLLWCSLILFLSIPAIALLTWFIRRLMGIRTKRHYLGYVFGSLWFIGLISVISLVTLIARNFRTRESIEESIPVSAPSNNKLSVKVERDFSEYYRYKRRSYRGFPVRGKNSDTLFLNNVRIDIIKSDDSAYHIHKFTAATGVNSEQASNKASNIRFPVIQNDTSLILPKGFTISKQDKFRNQGVLIV
ncbi:MAG: PspC domain-containing protein, partial [Chitinophagaceae bacterium]|nr:PspC domain-containing protein [Chitinophagaceae bacterium]